MAWFVYIVKCKDNLFYTGITWSLRQRVKLHNDGRYNSFTKPRRPVKLVYWERFNTRSESAAREKVIKGFSRFKKKELINSLCRPLS